MKKNLLSFLIILTFNAAAQDCSDLFISEYVEGPWNNNAIEISKCYWDLCRFSETYLLAF